MAVWQLQKAKSQLSKLIDEAHKKGPQIITRHGAERAVVLSPEEFHALTTNKPSLRDYLLGGPKVDEFEVPRETDTGRTIPL